MRSLLAIAVFAAIIGLSSAINVQNATQFVLGFGDGLEVRLGVSSLWSRLSDRFLWKEHQRVHFRRGGRLPRL